MQTIYNADTKRHCGGCTLCCRLLPMHSGAPGTPGSIHKAGGVRCPQQQTGKGCAIYSTRPTCCRLWSCQWLMNVDADDLRRPDRSRYVIDAMPDFVELRPNDGSEPTKVAVVQIWVDPKHPDAWREPALLAYIERRGKQGTGAIIRFNEHDAITVFPPTLANDGEWHEFKSNETGVQRRRQHTFAEVVKGLEDAQRDAIAESK